MLPYCVSVLRSGGTGRTHRILDSTPESRIYQRRRTSRFDAVLQLHHRAHPSHCNLSTLGFVDCLLVVPGSLDSWPEIKVLARDVGIENAFPPSIWGPAIHFQNKSPPIWNDLGHIPDVLSTPRKPCTPKGTIVNGLQGTVSLTVVALGASYAGKYKTRHVYLIHSAHTTYYSAKA